MEKNDEYYEYDKEFNQDNLRYHLYLDCMNVSDFPTLDDDQIAKILAFASRNGNLRFQEAKLSKIIAHLQLEYQKTMCQLMWNQNLQQKSQDLFFISRRNKISYRKYPSIITVMKGFEDVKKQLHWNILYVVPEVYYATSQVIEICSNITSMTLFCSNHGKCLTLEDFKAQQALSSTTVIKYLKSEWVDRIVQIIRMCLRDIGKGAYDIKQRIPYIYDVIKLKRFMELTIQLMQSALGNLIINSLSEYEAILTAPALMAVDINLEFQWGSKLTELTFPIVNSIFEIELMICETGAYFNTSLDEIQEFIVQLIDDCVIQLHRISQPQVFLIPELKFSNELYLSPIGLLDERIEKVRQRLKKYYEVAKVPVEAYRREYNRFAELWMLDVSEYVRNLKEEDFDTTALLEEISFHIAQVEELETKMPKQVKIGPFKVVLYNLRNFLINKRKDLATQLLHTLAIKLRCKVDNVLQEFEDIEMKLMSEPRTIEQIFVIKEYIENVHMNLKNPTEMMQILMYEYDTLEEFAWNISDDDCHAKLQAVCYPASIYNQIFQTEKFLNEETEKFMQVQFMDQLNLNKEIESLSATVTLLACQRDRNKVHECALDTKRTWKSLKECETQASLLNSRQKLFGLPVVSYDQLMQLIKDFEPYKTLWCTASDWLNAEVIWLENPMKNIDSEQMDRMVIDMQKSMLHSVRVFQNEPEIVEIARGINERINKFKPSVQLVSLLKSPGMKARHFNEINNNTEINVDHPTVTLKILIDMGIMDYMSVVTTTADNANKEYAVELTLENISGDWEDKQMEVIPYKNTGTYIIKVSDEMLLMLEEHILKIQQLNFSPFRDTFQDDINEWDNKLKMTQECLSLWIEVQKLWLYLEPIFRSDDITRQIPVEAKKFMMMERIWRRIMSNTAERPEIFKICPDKGLIESLKECIILMETVQRGLSDYLETKRLIFPRFFFLSDDELLEILSQAKNVKAVQPYLHKCFENIKSLEFEEDLKITKMFSTDGERVDLKSPIYPEGNVENWLGQVEEAMRNTLRDIIKNALQSVETTSRKVWVLLWAGQVVICATETCWTAHVENAIVNNTLKNCYKWILNHLEILRHLTFKKPSQIQRLMLEALITIQVHERDVTQKLMDKRINNVNNFDWISQLRYYWTNDDVYIRVINAEFPYGYEYLGNNGRLVITPLTDRCYLTLTGALHLKFGGAPSGPAGTGKTETTKDLAKAFAIQCVVFNCSDQLDFISMGKLFKGLASAGAWACFDEFNRIDIEVLSVIAQQILTIQRAQQMCMDRFHFEGVELVLKSSCAIFITMNPGYAGRAELPDNLKSLFRPVAMMVPNYALIAEISLFSLGFFEAKKLAGKITTTFKLSSEQLSSQDHYDFGMRAVKSVIAYAGILKRKNRDLNEAYICLRALKNVNVPKLSANDLELFNGIINDLFPGLKEAPEDYGVLEAEICKSIRHAGLKEEPEFIRKIIQLHETTTVRHGLMLVGPTASGKTTCYNILQNAYYNLSGQSQSNGDHFVPVQIFILNPKSITLGQLYGDFDVNTHEWTDGILPYLMRRGASSEDNTKLWYIFDGPVDAVWIESMNTLLDDNKKLCLTSGEIIKMIPTQTVIFETDHLKSASPATVSRCGMVYFESQLIKNESLIDCWIQSLSLVDQQLTSTLSRLTNELLFPALNFLRHNLHEVIPTTDVVIITFFINFINLKVRSNGTGELASENFLLSWTIFSLVWSVGAVCDYNSRNLFSEWIREIQIKFKHEIPFPVEGLVYDYRLCIDNMMNDSDPELANNQINNSPMKIQWIKWLDNDILYQTPSNAAFMDIKVPTMDSIRYSYLIEILLQNKIDVLCIGPTGSGKTFIISTKLAENMDKHYICDFITFSAKTSANQIQDLIDSKLEKRLKNTYGPPITKKQVFFIDDFNMPMVEEYGAQPALELIRQLIQFKGWYDRSKIGSFRKVEDVNIVSAMTTSSGVNVVSARILRQFHIVTLPDMDNDSKSNIFGTILKSWLTRTPTCVDLLDSVVAASLEFFSSVCRDLLPTPDKPHYIFNLRCLARIFQGMLMAEPEKINNENQLLSLWVHENQRVIEDRLMNEKDMQLFMDLLDDVLKKYFNNLTVKDLCSNERPILYADLYGNNGRYKRVYDQEKIKKILLNALEDYNEESSQPIKLVLFEEAISHVCRISRILRQSCGNALLLGTGGSGRKSLTKLSAFFGEHEYSQIESRRGYSINDWKEDIRRIMLRAGLNNRSIVFLFPVGQIKEDFYLEDLNSILNTGDVPNIYKPDELDMIFKAMRPIIQGKLQINKTNLFNAFLRNIRINLHIVITMSPVGEAFRSRIRLYSAMVNSCTIDWYFSWSAKALYSVANEFIKDITDDNIAGGVLHAIVNTCQFMHTSTIEACEDFYKILNRHNYVTPASYLEMLRTYGKLLVIKKKDLMSEMNRLSTGLAKLAVTEEEVKEMQIQLIEMKPKLEEATITTSRVIEQIRVDTLESMKTKAEAEEQEREAERLKKENEVIKNSAEADLSEVTPMLRAAEESLKSLNKSDITEVKAMKRPPPGVVLVIEAICIIKNVKPLKVPGQKIGEKILDYWTPGSQLLADAGRFMNDLVKFDKTQITEEMTTNLSYYINNPAFQPNKVAPKMESLTKAEASLNDTEMQLQMAMEKLQQVIEGINKLQELLDVEKARKSKLEKDKQICEDRIARAVRLINGLADEQKRWSVTVKEIQIAYKNCTGDILISSGAIAYLTPFTDVIRARLLDSWRRSLNRIPSTPGCTPVSILGDPVQIRQWQIDGLPRDSFSVENAVLMMNSKRWPLFIDPQRQAIKWLKKLNNKDEISVIKITDKTLSRTLENCVRFGRICIIENIGLELNPLLDNILTMSLFNFAGLLSVKIGDNIIQYNENFRLYITTMLSNPHYTPDISAKVLLVNFTLTTTGLLDQMLSLVVMEERPDLENMRSTLIVTSDQMKKDLKEIEDVILQRVSSTEGPAVDDIDLIVSLEASKIKSDAIKTKVAAMESTQIDIDSSRLLYLPVANRARILFTCINDLQKIDYMYQYSLEWFMNIFIKSINESEKNDDIKDRIFTINNYLTESLYKNVCCSLFEHNKLHFAFLLCTNIHIDRQLIDTNDWRFFLTGNTVQHSQSNPAPKWLSMYSWEYIQGLDTLDSFYGFSNFFCDNLKYFKSVFDTEKPEMFDSSPTYILNMSDFQRLLVLKCLRPERLINAIQLYIAKHLGRQFLEPQTTELSLIFQESSPSVPLVFILSSGTDPASQLYKFAEKNKMSKRLHAISLGQGQGPKAEAMIRESVEIGDWVFFQNCHLAPSWMPRLEELVDSFSETIHKDFRLWLTSMPTEHFPASILENSSKMTMEPPKGVKANLLRVYTNQLSEYQQTFDSTTPNIICLKSLLFCLGLFHSTLLERRKFGPLGLNIPYEFTDGDLAICVSQLNMFVADFEQFSFEVLIYTAGEINYGGRITDDWDRRCIVTLLQDYYSLESSRPDHQFDPQGLYYQLEATSSFEDYIDYIRTLPLNENAELFGLHTNADISHISTEVSLCLKTLLLVQSDETTEVGTDFEANLIEMANNILEKLPVGFNIETITERYPTMYKESLNVVIQHEVKRYNKLLTIIRVSVNELLKAFNGLIIMTNNLEAMSTSIFNNKVPQLWHDNAYPSLKPLGSWLVDLHKRVAFFKRWQDDGIPTAFWISGFFFPQVLLTATLQNFARRHKVAIDTIDFSIQIKKMVPSTKPINGCIIYGLFLEGCKWDGNSLEESNPRELYTEMDPILLLPEWNHQQADHGIYICPVYKTLKRSGTLSTTGHSTNFVISLEIPTVMHASHWIKRGVALICALNY